MEGAGNSFSSTAAQTIAQTILLNALVEKGDIKKLPKQISGKPDKERATAKHVNNVTGTYLAQSVSVKVTEGKEVTALVDPVRRQVGARTGPSGAQPTGPSGRRPRLDRRSRSSRRGAAKYLTLRGIGYNLPHTLDARPTCAVGWSHLAGLASARG